MTPEWAVSMGRNQKIAIANLTDLEKTSLEFKAFDADVSKKTIEIVNRNIIRPYEGDRWCIDTEANSTLADELAKTATTLYNKITSLDNAQLKNIIIVYMAEKHNIGVKKSEKMDKKKSSKASSAEQFQDWMELFNLIPAPVIANMVAHVQSRPNIIGMSARALCTSGHGVASDGTIAPKKWKKEIEVASIKDIDSKTLRTKQSPLMLPIYALASINVLKHEEDVDALRHKARAQFGKEDKSSANMASSSSESDAARRKRKPVANAEDDAKASKRKSVKVTLAASGEQGADAPKTAAATSGEKGAEAPKTAAATSGEQGAEAPKTASGHHHAKAGDTQSGEAAQRMEKAEEPKIEFSHVSASDTSSSSDGDDDDDASSD